MNQERAKRADARAAGPRSYDVAGPTGAPLICFLHGTRLTRGMWAAQTADLADAYRVVAVDLPGHGTEHRSPFTLEHAADQVAGVVREVAPDGQAIIVGLSLGGYVGMVLAARHPGSVRGLILSGASAEPVGWRAVPFRLLALALERVDGRRLAALNAWFFRTRFPAAIADPILAGGFWPEGGGVALRALIGRCFLPLLTAYQGPVLLINGEYDPLFRLTAGDFRRAVPRARWARIAGASHLANLDRPSVFGRAVRRFAEGLEATDLPRP